MTKTTIVNLKLGEAYDVYIGRGSKWGNPYRITASITRDESIGRYEKYIRTKTALLADLGELVGKRLACFCMPAKCHGDILIKLINERNPQPKATVARIVDVDAASITQLDRIIDRLEGQEKELAHAKLERSQEYIQLDPEYQDDCFIPSQTMN